MAGATSCLGIRSRSARPWRSVQMDSHSTNGTPGGLRIAAPMSRRRFRARPASGDQCRLGRRAAIRGVAVENDRQVLSAADRGRIRICGCALERRRPIRGEPTLKSTANRWPTATVAAANGMASEQRRSAHFRQTASVCSTRSAMSGMGDRLLPRELRWRTDGWLGVDHRRLWSPGRSRWRLLARHAGNGAFRELRQRHARSAWFRRRLSCCARAEPVRPMSGSSLLLAGFRPLAVRNQRTARQQGLSIRRMRYAHHAILRRADAAHRALDRTCFSSSENYPATINRDVEPWLQDDPRTQTESYLRAVLDYVFDGNFGHAEASFDPARNRKRAWYNAPWQDVGISGREFIHGLTRERVSRPYELAPQQTRQLEQLCGRILQRARRHDARPDLERSRRAECRRRGVSGRNGRHQASVHDRDRGGGALSERRTTLGGPMCMPTPTNPIQPRRALAPCSSFRCSRLTSR